MNNIHIPQLLEKSSDFNPKEFQKTLRNITLKLHFEYALISIIEIMQINHVKAINVHGTSTNNQFMINNFGKYDVDVPLEEETLSKKFGRYCTIFFEDSFKDLTAFKQKQVINQIKKQCKQVNRSLHGLGLDWWDIDLNTNATKMFNMKYPHGFTITHNNQTQQQFINDFLPNQWGEYRASLQEQKHFNELIEEQNVKPKSTSKQSKL